MKVIASSVRVVGKNHKSGEGKNGPYELFEVQCGNGEGGVVNLGCNKELFEKVETFVPYTAEVDLYQKGYNLGGELMAVYVE